MKLTFTLTAFTVLVCNVFGHSDGLRASHSNHKKSLAVEGYGPVSHFDGKALDGKSHLEFVYRGITYYFGSVLNLAKYKANPDSLWRLVCLCKWAILEKK